MEFKKYQHVERFLNIETEGIENGMCYLFPKLDGANSQLWWDNGLRAGSRNRELSFEKDNAGFYEWAINQQEFNEFFSFYPDLRLYGEWLVPHTLRTYKDSAWRKFYVFDVMRGHEYLHYEEYGNLLDKFGIEYIPPLCKIENPSYEQLAEHLENNTYLIKEGMGAGEGIVIKNYEYKNKYGRATWAKIVRSEFKAKQVKGTANGSKETKIVEEEIVRKYVTRALVEKEFSKIDNDGGWSSTEIPRLLNTVYYCLVKEEAWNFVKDFKNPTIDFKRLAFYTRNMVKELMPQLF